MSLKVWPRAKDRKASPPFSVAPTFRRDAKQLLASLHPFGRASSCQYSQFDTIKIHISLHIWLSFISDPMTPSNSDPKASRSHHFSECLQAVLDACQEDHKAFSSESKHKMTRRLRSASPPPPVDEITTCSDDESASISSVSSAEGDESTPSKLSTRPRSLFGSYWDKSSDMRSLGRPLALSRALLIPHLPSEEDSQDCYERTLREVQEEGSPSRRQIFSRSCYSQSTPSLARSPRTVNFRKTKSVSALETSLPSCLRTRQESKARSQSVSFQEQVTISVFEPPKEIWAPSGWSNWFAA